MDEIYVVGHEGLELLPGGYRIRLSLSREPEPLLKARIEQADWGPGIIADVSVEGSRLTAQIDGPEDQVREFAKRAVGSANQESQLRTIVANCRTAEQAAASLDHEIDQMIQHAPRHPGAG